MATFYERHSGALEISTFRILRESYGESPPIDFEFQFHSPTDSKAIRTKIFSVIQRSVSDSVFRKKVVDMFIVKNESAQNGSPSVSWRDLSITDLSNVCSFVERLSIEENPKRLKLSISEEFLRIEINSKCGGFHPEIKKNIDRPDQKGSESVFLSGELFISVLTKVLSVKTKHIKDFDKIDSQFEQSIGIYYSKYSSQMREKRFDGITSFIDKMIDYFVRFDSSSQAFPESTEGGSLGLKIPLSAFDFKRSSEWSSFIFTIPVRSFIILTFIGMMRVNYMNLYPLVKKTNAANKDTTPFEERGLLPCLRIFRNTVATYSTRQLRQMMAVEELEEV